MDLRQNNNTGFKRKDFFLPTGETVWEKAAVQRLFYQLSFDTG
jgi:hypothetical protein